ncbi:hypothetical protein F4677DRAFT_64641 [Hypoxylon crocopeplum]|nr:hypothetical protein F4677DRAFT_64641 [Hypoxylon crocopeplum]
MKNRLAHIGLFKAIFLVVEFGLVLVTMSLLCCAYPERFRKTLWQIGGENGWNSNPRLRIYFYANYQQPPEIPLIWTQRLSESNLAISVLAAAVCLSRIVLAYSSVPGGFSCVFNALNDMLLSGFWMYSVAAQSSSDLTDPDHFSVRPWYLEKSCNILDASVVEVCLLAKACFAFSVLSLVFFFGRSIFSVLRLAYWCGQFQLLDRGLSMLYPRFQGCRPGSQGSFTISDAQMYENWYDGPMEESLILDTP